MAISNREKLSKYTGIAAVGLGVIALAVGVPLLLLNSRPEILSQLPTVLTPAVAELNRIFYASIAPIAVAVIGLTAASCVLYPEHGKGSIDSTSY